MGVYSQLECLSKGFIDYVFQVLSDTTVQVHFVQVGAHDGKTDDPLYNFIVDRNWVGARVEPVPDTFAKLQKNCKHLSDVKLMQVVCSSDTTPRPFYSVAPGPDGYYSFLSSFDRSVILAHRSLVPDIEDRLVENFIETLTLTDIVDRAEMPGVDLISVDAEGFDDDVVRSLDYIKHRPKVIFFEHKHIREMRLRELDDFLKIYGYSSVRLHTDTFYISEDFRDAVQLPKLKKSAQAIFSF